MSPQFSSEYILKLFPGTYTSINAELLLSTCLNEKYPEDILGDLIKWNLNKFLIDRDRNVVKRFEPAFESMDMEADIDNL